MGGEGGQTAGRSRLGATKPAIYTDNECDAELPAKRPYPSTWPLSLKELWSVVPVASIYEFAQKRDLKSNIVFFGTSGQSRD